MFWDINEDCSERINRKIEKLELIFSQKLS